MKIRISFAILLLFLLCQPAVSQPGTEIYLFDLKTKGNTITISNARNITQHPGYDNQPFFHPSQTLLYYTSADEQGRTDIVEYNYKTGASKKITQTREREYSPTVTPDKKFLSCIIQRDSGQQDLGKYPIEGGEPQVIIDNLTVGYHAWIDHDNVVLFVLGEPNTLRWYVIPDKKDYTLTDSIGRSLQRIPGKNSVSFIRRTSAGGLMIARVEKLDSPIVRVAEGLKGGDFHAWTSTGKILMSDDKKIFWMDPARESIWNEVVIRTSLPLNTITRLAVNQKDKLLAVVLNE